MDKVRTVKLLGAAGRKFGREFQLAVKSPAEAYRALCVLCPGLKAWTLAQHEKGVAWRVVTDKPEGLKEEELNRETGVNVITFAPVMKGAAGNGGGALQIVVGVALIAAALIIPFAAMGGGLALGLLGGSLVLSGIATLLTPTPTTPKTSKTGNESSIELESNLFTRNAGNGGQGEVVPVLYGQRRIPAPRVVSFDLRLLPESRSVNTSGTVGLLGYVNRVEL